MRLDIEKAYVQRRLEIDGYDIHMTAIDGFTKGIVSSACFTVTMIDPANPVYLPAPIQMSEMAAQVLFQAMWDAGLRPSNGESSGAHVQALKNHLDDMRLIALAHVMPPEVKPDSPSATRGKGTF